MAVDLPILMLELPTKSLPAAAVVVVVVLWVVQEAFQLGPPGGEVHQPQLQVVVTQVSAALRVLEKQLQMHQVRNTAEMDLLGPMETAVLAELVEQTVSVTLPITRQPILSVVRAVVPELAPEVVIPTQHLQIMEHTMVHPAYHGLAVAVAAMVVVGRVRLAWILMVLELVAAVSDLREHLMLWLQMVVPQTAMVRMDQLPSTSCLKLQPSALPSAQLQGAPVSRSLGLT